MSVSQHGHYDPQNTQNQNNQMSDDPKDGARGTEKLKEGGGPEMSPEEKAQRDPKALEEFGERGSAGGAER